MEQKSASAASVVQSHLSSPSARSSKNKKRTIKEARLDENRHQSPRAPRFKAASSEDRELSEPVHERVRAQNLEENTVGAEESILQPTVSAVVAGTTGRGEEHIERTDQKAKTASSKHYAEEDTSSQGEAGSAERKQTQTQNLQREKSQKSGEGEGEGQGSENQEDDDYNNEDEYYYYQESNENVQLAEASRNMSNLIVNRGTSNSNTFDPFAKQQQNSRITPYTVNILKKQFIAIENSQLIASVGLANDSILEWNVCFEGPSKSLYEGGIFQSKLYFPNDFPNSPPVMKFITPMWHPNIFIDGRVCISILHPPGHDQFNESELESEKWRPILTAEDVLISVISMLQDPNIDSPANIDASKQFRDDRKSYEERVRNMTKQSAQN